MIKYFKMKKKEIELKLTLYTCISSLVEEKKDIISLGVKLYSALKDTSESELQEKLLSEIANLTKESSDEKKE